MLKLLVQGKVNWILYELGPLIKAFKGECSDTSVTIANLEAWMLGKTDKDLAKLTEAGCDGYYILQKADDLLYVPPGFLAFEKSMEGPLIYGLRKSVAIADKRCLENFSLAAKLTRDSGKPADNMDAVYKLMEEKSEESKTEAKPDASAKASGS